MHWTKTKPHKHTEPLLFTTHKRDSQVELQHSTENSKQGEEDALDTQHALQTWEMYTTFSLVNLKGLKKTVFSSIKQLAAKQLLKKVIDKW